jgi:hypothetical protein
MTHDIRTSTNLDETTFRKLWWVLFSVGIAISLVMVYRSQLGGDQINMLIRGWFFAFDDWQHVGQPTSAGGLAPGGLIGLLVGLPLKIWPDDRAATLLIWILGVAGYLILDRLVGRAFGNRGRILFAVFYWLNPWRMHYTSSLWNTNYMFFIGAIHAWCAHRMRERRAFWATFVMALIPPLSFQLHAAAAIFGFASILLWWRRVVRVNWWGVAAAVVATVLCYLPWFLTVAGQQEIIPGGTGFPFRNLVLVLPFVKGVIYLLRYASLALPGRVYGLDLVPASSLDDAISGVLSIALVTLGWLSFLLALVAYRRLIRGRRRLLTRRDWAGNDRLWLRGYVLWSLGGALIAFAVTPTSVMFWQGFPVFHAATLVVVFFMVTALRSRRAATAHRLTAGWLAASVAVSILIAIGSPMFRPHARPNGHDPSGGHVQKIKRDHPFFHDLNLYERLDLEVVGEGGYVPDLLRKPDERKK